MESENAIMIPEEVILSKIYQIRNPKVMFDTDLALLYGVETKQLKRAVGRNIRRFPPDFMFEITSEEFDLLRSHSGTSRWGGARYLPMAFTEQGVAMLSSVLNSDRAILVNISIIRIFIRIREMLATHKDILDQLADIKQRLTEHDGNIILIFDYLKKMEQLNQEEVEIKERRRIGYKT